MLTSVNLGWKSYGIYPGLFAIRYFWNLTQIIPKKKRIDPDTQMGTDVDGQPGMKIKQNVKSDSVCVHKYIRWPSFFSLPGELLFTLQGPIHLSNHSGIHLWWTSVAEHNSPFLAYGKPLLANSFVGRSLLSLYLQPSSRSGNGHVTKAWWLSVYNIPNMWLVQGWVYH